MPLTPDEAVDQVDELRKLHDRERNQLDVVRQYWKGRQQLPAVIPSSAPSEVRQMARIARVNICDIVVESLTQSTFVDDFRAEVNEDGQRVDRSLSVWDVWQANRFDRDQTAVHKAAFAYGTSYVTVLPGDPVPKMDYKSPRQMTAMYGEDRDWPTWALENAGNGLWKLYDDEAIYYVGTDNNSFQLQYIETREHRMGVCPVVRYRDEVDADADDEVASGFGHHDVGVVLGQVAPLMKLQDQIDLTTFNLLVAQHYTAFRQRYILGWVADSEEQKMKAAASQLWTFEDHPDDVQAGEFSQTNLDGYIKSREASLRHSATLSQTPVHELTGELVNLSAEALAAAEAGRDRKVDLRQTSLGESHEQTFQLVGMLIGEDIPNDSEVVWRDTSARAFAATVDALGKLTQMLGVPPQELWERIPNTTRQEIERWKAAAAEGDAFSQLASMFERQADEDEGDEF